VIDRDKFFPSIRASLFAGNLGQGQVDGMQAILDAWEHWVPAADVRFVCYSLATAYHETAATMQPIDEYGQGRGHSYGVPTGPWHQAYFGRGDVQLTWEANYAHATKRLRELGVLDANDNLEANPELAERPDIAAAIMIMGMIEGWFTGAKLGGYFSATNDDPVNARRIINGTDCAEKIADYHDAFLDAAQAP
jgi:putative chitinase